jgi:type II secretory pathway component PulF
VAQAFAGLLDPLDVALLRAGEASGGLERTLREAADQHDLEASRRSRRRAASLYPFLLAHLAALLLPLPDWLAGNVGTALLVTLAVLGPLYLVVGLLVLGDRRSRPPTGASRPPRPPPHVGPFAAAVEERDARALVALARLHDAGVPLDESVELSMRAGWGGRAACDLVRARERVRGGESLAGAWRELPQHLATSLAVAEQVGEVGAAARRAAVALQDSAEARRTRIAAVFPVVLMLLIGAVIAWRVFSFYGGLYARLGR